MRTESVADSRNSRHAAKSTGAPTTGRLEPDADPNSTEPAEPLDPWLVAEIVLLLVGILLALSLLKQTEAPCFFAADESACVER